MIREYSLETDPQAGRPGLAVYRIAGEELVHEGSEMPIVQEKQEQHKSTFDQKELASQINASRYELRLNSFSCNSKERIKKPISPILEEKNGRTWFMSRYDDRASHSYFVLQGGECFEIPWPSKLKLGRVQPFGRDRFLASCGKCLAIIDARDDSPANWKIEQVYLLRGAHESGGVFLDQDGYLVGKQGWSAKLTEETANSE